MISLPDYSVAIRTLGKAGDKYVDLISSLKNQIHPPKAIYVYIAEGYQQPVAVADEIYVSCPKGMVRQRARRYEEIDTDYILFCDDDVFLPSRAIQILFDAIMTYHADGIAPNVFPNHKCSLKDKIIAALYCETLPSFFAKYAVRIRKSSHFSYALWPKRVMPTQSFAGPCFLIKKEAFLAIHFEDECWMDKFSYPLGEDQLLAYKLFLSGYSLLTHFDSGIEHRDARTSRGQNSPEHFRGIVFMRYLLWYRTIYQTRISRLSRCHAALSFWIAWLWRFIMALLLWVIRKNKHLLPASIIGLQDARRFAKSDEYRHLPKFNLDE